MTRERGIPPREVACRVFEGIAAGDFWITTSDTCDELLRRRGDAVVARRLPPAAQY